MLFTGNYWEKTAYKTATNLQVSTQDYFSETQYMKKTCEHLLKESSKTDSVRV